MNIKTKKDLQNVIKADIGRCHDFAGKKMWMEYLKGNLYSYTIYKYIKKLRTLEYWSGKRSSLTGKIGYAIAKHQLERYQLKTPG